MRRAARSPSCRCRSRRRRPARPRSTRAAARPSVQRVVGVAAGVELLCRRAAARRRIGPIACSKPGPLAGRVGHDQGARPCSAQLAQRLVGREARAAAARGRGAAAGPPPRRTRACLRRAVSSCRVASCGRLARRTRAAARGSPPSTSASYGELRRQLPQHRARACRPGPARPEAKKLASGASTSLQPLHVGDEAATLDREHEVVGHLRAPLRPAGRPLEGVERAVDLDRGQLRGGVLQLAALRQALRVEVAAPGRVASSRRCRRGSCPPQYPRHVDAAAHDRVDAARRTAARRTTSPGWRRASPARAASGCCGGPGRRTARSPRRTPGRRCRAGTPTAAWCRDPGRRRPPRRSRSRTRSRPGGRTAARTRGGRRSGSPGRTRPSGR